MNNLGNILGRNKDDPCNADSSPSSSPVRKRQRLSSPTYDEHLGDLTQDDLIAFDHLEARNAQTTALDLNLQPNSYHANSRTVNTSTNITDDPDNPFAASTAIAKEIPATFTTASSGSLPSFSKASFINVNMMVSSQNLERSPSPEEPPAQDFDAWFQPTAIIPPPAFQIASTVVAKTPMAMGFKKASDKEMVMPSSSALARAQAKMQDIWQEPELISTTPFAEHLPPPLAINALVPAADALLKSPIRRPALKSLGNSLALNSPVTPTPPGLSRSSTTSKTATSTPTPTELFISQNSRPFKSPLKTRKRAAPGTTPGSTLNPSYRGVTSIVMGSQSTPTSTNHTPITAHQHPPKLGTNLRPNSPAAFVTPFKPGMKLRQIGRSQLRAGESQSKQAVVAKDISKEDQPRRTSFFDLIPSLDRQTLKSSEWTPQQLGPNELEAMEIPVELLQMTPQLAIYYSFHAPADTPTTSDLPVLLGPTQALNTLIDNGCSLATKAWVDNHWGLILWKLAGMVCLNPQQEYNTHEKRWCWNEVMRQFFYRYERELNGGKRPPLRLITTRDAPAAYPMVLCISDVIWTESESPEHHKPYPELEVTDGWYRLRARVDAPLTRAIRRGLIKVGRKIGVAGAYLISERKEPSEVLEAYNSVKLAISGNSSHMAPWHAKLGFAPGPCISTLHSLTPDGGMVAAMDLVVVKAHPIAYIEFIEDENGHKTRRGPMNANEEAAAHERWMKRWENELSKLHTELEAKWNRYGGYIERLERRAGAVKLVSSQDDFPEDIIEKIYDELEDPAQAPKVIADLAKSECGYLARYIRERMEKDKAHTAEDIENEMRRVCPPRDVRNFRIIVVQDARTQRRPGNRKALLNVWDVLNLSFYEGAAPGSFEVGQRFMVTNLKPTHEKSWMGLELNAEVFLCTGQSSRWTPIKTSNAS